MVATVPTACGIETMGSALTLQFYDASCNSTYRLRYWNEGERLYFYHIKEELQQYLPLAVLKRYIQNMYLIAVLSVATVPTACGIETLV